MRQQELEDRFEVKVIYRRNEVGCPGCGNVTNKEHDRRQQRKKDRRLRDKVVSRLTFGAERRTRPGKKAKYDTVTEKRILAQSDEPPPTGYATWSGRLVAEALGNVSRHHVWRVLRKHGIHLQRRHSWCVSTDPEFTQKAADIVGAVS